MKSCFVHCLMRSGAKVGINSIFLKMIDGDADNSQDLADYIEGKDVVVSAYGIGEINNPNAITEYTKKLIESMQTKVL